MTRRSMISMLVAVCIMYVGPVAAQEKRPVKVPEIPGITVEDKVPNGCVGCHKNRPERKKDGRLTTTLKKWGEEVKPKRLEMAQATMPPDAKLKGKHPDVQKLVHVIPDDCLMCHRKGSKTVPPFASLLHAIHLTGGKDNHFIVSAGGHCGHCHKLNKKTGEWSLGTGKE